MRTICKSLLNPDGFDEDDVKLTLARMLFSPDFKLEMFRVDNGISFVSVEMEFMKLKDEKG